MKKFILPLLVAVVSTIAFSSCDGDKVVPTSRVLTSYYTIPDYAHNIYWQKLVDNQGRTIYYYATIPNSDIKESVIETGAVLAYFCHKDGDKILPYTMFQEDPNKPGTFYEDMLSYDVKSGSITVMISSSDFGADYTVENVGPIQIKVSAIGNYDVYLKSLAAQGDQAAAEITEAAATK